MLQCKSAAYEFSFENRDILLKYCKMPTSTIEVEKCKRLSKRSQANRIICTRWECQIKSQNHSLNLCLLLSVCFRRLQFISFRLSIFNEVISFAIKHIPVLAIEFSARLCFSSFFPSIPTILLAHRWIQSNYLSLSVCVCVFWLSWFSFIRMGFSVI